MDKNIKQILVEKVDKSVYTNHINNDEKIISRLDSLIDAGVRFRYNVEFIKQVIWYDNETYLVIIQPIIVYGLSNDVFPINIHSNFIEIINNTLNKALEYPYDINVAIEIGFDFRYGKTSLRNKANKLTDEVIQDLLRRLFNNGCNVGNKVQTAIKNADIFKQYYDGLISKGYVKTYKDYYPKNNMVDYNKRITLKLNNKWIDLFMKNGEFSMQVGFDNIDDVESNLKLI